MTSFGYSLPEISDTNTYYLPDVEIKGEASSGKRRSDDGSIKLSVGESLKLTRAFGEADLVASLKSLPAVEAGSDYSSGISVNGAIPSQTQYLVDGTPVVFPYRFGGIFSIFNTSHFSSLTFFRQSSAGLSPRLGGVVSLESSRKFKGEEGVINVGLISSSATVKAGMNDKVALSLSGRVSYIDQLYGKFFSGDRNTLGYSFYDLNASFAWKISSSNLLSASFFHNSDQVGYLDWNYGLNTRLQWRNTGGGVSFSHSGMLNIKSNIWLSYFADRLSLSMPQFLLNAPSSLIDGGGKISISGEILHNLEHNWEVGILGQHLWGVPQWASLEMSEFIEGIGNRFSERSPQKMMSGMVYGRWSCWPVSNRLKIEAGLSAGFFVSRRKEKKWWRTPLFSPRLKLVWKEEKLGDLEFGAGWLQQYLHQVGFSELGLASDFIIGSNAQLPVQNGVVFDITWTRKMFLGFRLSVAGFWSIVGNQSEYQGQVLEVIDEDYDPFQHIVISNGCNYGVSVGVSREFGSINGEVSYSYGGGERYESGNRTETWQPINSPGNTFKFSLSWHPSSHWVLSANYMYHTGRVYTPVKALYLVGGNIAMEYGRRNSARLPYYSRLDLGVTYILKSSVRVTHLVNISLLNALGRRNVEMQYFLLHPGSNSYGMKSLYSLYRFIPSVSYAIEFK